MHFISLALVGLLALFLWSPASPLRSQVSSADDISHRTNESSLEADMPSPDHFDPCAYPNGSALPQCPDDDRAY